MKKNKILETMLSTDVYKTGHATLYPKGLEVVFSNFTPRSGNWAEIDEGGVIAIGMRYVINSLIKEWDDNFFKVGIEEMVDALLDYRDNVEEITGAVVDIDKWTELYKLGKLPLEFRAVEEGAFVPFKTPVLTVHNTDKRFPWLVNYLETRISSELWPIITAATKAKVIKDKLNKFADMTGTSREFVPYQAHDFSFRGMEGAHGAKLTGLGHLHFFEGSDNLPAILEAGHGASVVATEHSIMSAGTKEKEFETYKRLIVDNPKGILSIVSDTWNIYNVVDNILPKLKKEINARDGKLVIRPDSGEPISQLLGGAILPDKEFQPQADLGLFKLIEKHFGYMTNDKGFKILPIGFLWGDGMTLDRIEKVYQAMADAGYASENLVVGVGSYTYQLNTRDTYGFAMKATYVEVNGVGRNITKNPITDSGVKKSSTGLLAIINGKLVEETTWEVVNSEENELKAIDALKAIKAEQWKKYNSYIQKICNSSYEFQGESGLMKAYEDFPFEEWLDEEGDK